MTGFAEAAAYLPPGIRDAVGRLPDRLVSTIQEIRLRADAPLVLSAPDGEWMLTAAGVPTLLECGTIHCTRAAVEECVLRLCDYSLHTHQQELRSGYIAARGGLRAGVAGTAVVDKGEVVSLRSFTSVCLRVAREHEGCSAALCAAMLNHGAPRSTLICGEPSSGKSSLLRDLAKRLASGDGGRRYRVAVVDERGELSGTGGLAQCDVLRGCPKPEGLQQAVRCLAPEIVLFDELGTAEESRAVLEGLNAGVAAVATAHCRDIETLLRRPQLREALESGAFDQVAFLEGRRSPGRIERMVETGDLLAQGNRTNIGRSDWNRRGADRFGGTQPASILP